MPYCQVCGRLTREHTPEELNDCFERLFQASGNEVKSERGAKLFVYLLFLSVLSFGVWVFIQLVLNGGT
jgi:hypothetical protein